MPIVGNGLFISVGPINDRTIIRFVSLWITPIVVVLVCDGILNQFNAKTRTARQLHVAILQFVFTLAKGEIEVQSISNNGPYASHDE
jgi:hypothetical protein